MSTTSSLCVILVLAAGAGCGGRKQHLIEGYGSSYDPLFASQRVGKPSAPAVAVTGLDSQEAAIISDDYRQSLAPKGHKVGEEPVVLVAPPSKERPIPLAPSVPKEK
jgi:hypothetical protein